MENFEPAVAILDKEENMAIAYRDGLRTIAQLIPYLEYRQSAAKKYFEICETEEQKANYRELIEHCNKEIKTVLGID